MHRNFAVAATRRTDALGRARRHRKAVAASAIAGEIVSFADLQ
jgi:hypothetical protein